MSLQVTSNESDYAPFTTAFFTATGFGIGDALSFVVSIIDPIDGSVSPLNADAPDALAWTVIDGSSGDLDSAADGSATASWYVDPYYANTTLQVTVTDLTTGDTASEVFTDSTPNGSGLTENAPLQIVKSVVSVGGVAGDGPVTYAGEPIVYQIVVTNTGATALTNVVVTDPLTGFTHTIASLAGNASYTSPTITYNATQADINDSGNLLLNPGSQVFVSNDAASAYEFVSFTGGAAPWFGGVSTNIKTGQQVLTLNPGNTNIPAQHIQLDAWCVDVGHEIIAGNQSIVYTLSQLGVPIHNATQIAEVAAWGDQQLSLNPANPNLIAAAVQAEIWELEYPGLTVTSSKDVGGNVTTAALTNEISFINNVVLPTLSPISGGAELTYTSGGSHGIAQTLFVPPGIENTASAMAGDNISTSTVVTPLGPSVALDKQISTDGVNWLDAGNGNLADDPSVLVGSTLYERVIVTNTGAVALSSLTVSDIGGNGPASFAVGTSLDVGQSETSAVATISAGSGYELDTATVTGTGTDSVGNTASVTASDQANYTGVTASVALDKQISTDGTTWVDAGNGNLADDPSVLVGSTLYERVIVTNTGSVALSSLTVSDVGGNGPASFAVGTSLAVGQSEISTVATISAGSGYELDTATVTGTGTDSVGNSTSVTASDQANYTGVTASVALDKQISTDGTTWVDAGNGNLAQDPSVLVGSTIYERVIVTNTGAVALSSLTVSDIGGNGPASFAVGTSLAVGANEISAVATISAGSGYELDTATVTGTGTDSVGNTTSVTASDQANYTGVTASVALDKQISTDGTTWVDAGNGNLAQDPSVLVGSTIYERVIVTNTGAVALSSLTVSDIGGNGPASFAVGTSLDVGQSETSAVATISAGSGYELDTATVNGTGTDTVGNTTSVTASDQANYTGVTASVALDKQISTDGTTWVDAGNGNLADDPSVLVGTTLYERVIVTNTGAVALSSLTVSDIGGNGPASFAVGTSLDVGQSETSAVATISAGSGYELDTATVNGTGTDTVGNTTSVTASDQANYTGVTASVALDKQISTDGTTWVDAGNGNLADDPSVLVGSTLYERVIVTNTGSVALSSLTVSDVGGNGPASFAVGTSLAVGQSEISTVATISAGSGYELDTATVTGTGTDTVGNTASVTASDQANYTGVTPQVDLSVTKTDGQTSVMAGSTDTYTITVTNNGPSTVGSFTMTDAIPAALLNPMFGLPSAGAYNPVTGQWTGLSLASGQSVSITLSGTIDPGAGPSGTSFTASGVGGDGTENATATITTLNGQILVTLASNVANPTAAGQEVSGIRFTVGGPLGATSLSSSSGTLINIAPGGAVTPAAGSINHWGIAQSGSSLTLATAGTGAVGGKPIDLIIGGGPYTNANPSITGRDPQISGTATFVISAPGVTAGETISGVEIEFGTGPDAVVAAQGSSSGGSITNTVTVTAPGGYTDTNPGNNTASDTDTIVAGHGSISVEKLVSVDGGTNWYFTADDASDTIASINAQTGISAAHLHAGNAPITAGAPIEFEVVVTNTGNATDTNISVSDVADTVALNGVNFTFGGSNTLASLAAGASKVSDAINTNASLGTHTDTASTTATALGTSVGDTDSATYVATSSTGGGNSGGGGISIIKLPCQVVVGTCGQVTYTYDVTNTGSAPLTNVNLVDNIGTAAHPNDVTPVAVTSKGYNVGDANHNGVLDSGETWVYQNTINESGDYSSKGGSAHCSVSGSNLGGGCTAWLNSSFTPTSCADGAKYSFQNITCTITGPGCGTITECVPNAVVQFSKSCTQASTVYDASQNCWITTLPANCNPGNVFLSGLPFQVPSGCSLTGATVTWNIGQSGNNCGSGNVNWQVGCQGYSNFQQNSCDGLSDYNQIGVKACDNQSGYGNGGNTGWGYGWDTGGSSNYCSFGWGCGSWGWGGWSGWDGSSNDCAGTPENQYTSSNCSSGSYWGWGSGSYGGGSSGGTCGNGSGSGSCNQGQLGNSPEADTVTVTATTLGQGFSLGDAGNYGIIAFAPSKFIASNNAPINGNVGLGVSCGLTTVQLNGDKITGNLVATGAKPTTTGGTVTGTISGNSATLAGDINALNSLSSQLAGESGTSIALSAGQTVNATSGLFDSMGDEVFTITKWADNITISGDGSHDVVLNFAAGIAPKLDNVTLTGGITANEVLFNYTGSSTIGGVNGETFNATMLAPNAVFTISNSVTVNGHLYGGNSGQNFTFNNGAKLNTPANTGSGGTTTTVTASDSKEVEVLANNSSITVGGSTPTGSLSALYGKAETIEFSYSPSDTVSVKTIGIGVEAGHNASSMAFIEISNNANPFAAGATIYFEGEVQTGEKIFADATLNQLTNTPVAAPNNVFSQTPGADIYAYVFNSQADFKNFVAPSQMMAYNTSGSQAMHFGDQIASLTVAGYVGSTGGHLLS